MVLVRGVERGWLGTHVGRRCLVIVDLVVEAIHHAQCVVRIDRLDVDNRPNVFFCL